MRGQFELTVILKLREFKLQKASNRKEKVITRIWIVKVASQILGIDTPSLEPFLVQPLVSFWPETWGFMEVICYIDKIYFELFKAQLMGLFVTIYFLILKNLNRVRAWESYWNLRNHGSHMLYRQSFYTLFTRPFAKEHWRIGFDTSCTLILLTRQGLKPF